MRLGFARLLGSTGFFHAWAAMFLLWAAPASSLPTVYQETGDPFMQFLPPYDGSMQIESTVTFATPLPANLISQDFAPSFEASGDTYSFFDGVVTYNLTNSTPVDLRFSTNNSGNITTWQVEIFSNAGPIILSQNIPSIPDSGFDKVLSSSAQQLALSGGPATWAVVPEPAVLTLSALGLFVLAVKARRRSA